MADRPVTDVRATAPHERRAAADTMRHALLNGPAPDDLWAKAEPGWQDQLSISAWQGDRCVGHAGAFRFRTVVPGGGRVATAGVTRVGVIPTATRQGLLTRMMQQLLVIAREDGQVLASLRASEAVIYRRFGFGIGADGVGVTIDVRRARPLAHRATGSVRLLDRSEILDVVMPLYERVATRPGVISRPHHLFTRYLEDALEGDKASFVVVHTSLDGVDDGFAHYSVGWSEESFQESYGTGEVHDVWGATPAVELALWDHLLGIDLVRTYTAEERPVDDVLRLAVRDPRAYRTNDRYDEQWIRLLDVEACLAARRYRPSRAVTIAVVDPMFPDNTDTFEVGPTAVRRLGADRPAELTCAIDVLSSAYLGAVTWSELAAAGRVAGESAAVGAADDLFAHRPGAFCGSFF